ncbi:MAG TPA: Gfo/Idh/MocA family oxidoreductase [Pirellulales bacterium]|nr:Gfo/Idh/MocA family oxidoreductase [Pirellulales bacterium]
MNDLFSTGVSRRQLLKTTGAAAAVTAFANLTLPQVHAAEDNTVQLALVGCGGRGTGAAENALSTQQGPVKLVAMADIFPERLNSSYAGLKHTFDKLVDVPADRKFIGFDAYKKAIDCLKPGDIVLLTTPPAFRWVMFTYAVEKGLNVFMEKPVSVDGPTTKKMLKLAEESIKKNMKVGVGLMCRHCEARGELKKRLDDGQIGDINLLRAYRVVGPTGSAFVGAKPEGISEVAYQIKNFHAFLWASGGAFSDFLIHNLDECCWMKGSFPVEAKAFGGRHYRGNYVDQNFDTYTVEYMFDDGAKLMLEGRCMDGCYNEFASYAHGSKGAAVISTSSHSPAKCRIYKSQKINTKADQTWAFGKHEPNPYQLEWNDLMTAIRHDQPYNEVQRAAQASLCASMGRMASHTGQVITYEDILNCPHEFAPMVDRLTLDGPAPLVAGADGKYPIPMPGKVTNREYA